MSTMFARAESRPAFRDGQVLRAGDLRAEDADRVAAARRHQQAAHLPGIVAGLWLSTDGATLSPGMAIDAAGRTILVAITTPVTIPFDPVEVWIAYRETPLDADSPQTPTGPPARYLESYDLLFLPPGEYDPSRPDGHLCRSVFLGAIVNNAAKHDGRVYVGAVGGRVEAASRRVRLLLGPEDPRDLRLFAVSTRPADNKPYTDHLTIETTGTAHFLSPTSIAGQKPASPAIVVAGYRPVDFLPCDVRDCVALVRRILALTKSDNPVPFSEISPIDQERPVFDRLKEANSPPAEMIDRTAALVCRILNRAVFQPVEKSHLAEQVRRTGARLRPETVRLLLDEAADSTRADPPRLHRLLLEDAFAGLLAPLGGPAGPLGITFVGARAEPTEALPARVYLASAAVKGQTLRKLRVEVKDPGKENHPERYRLSIGTASPHSTDRTRSVFQACLTVDASRTVTIAKKLTVLHYDEAKGKPTTNLGPPPQRVTPPAGPGAAPPVAPPAPVAPWDLAIRELAPSKTSNEVRFGVELTNAGAADISAVQVLASVFARTDASVEPTRRTLARGLLLHPATPLQLPNPDNPAERTIALPLTPELQNRELLVILTAVGLAPGNVQPSAERRFKV